MINLISTFIFFLAVIDPIGTIPVYIEITKRYDNGMTYFVFNRFFIYLRPAALGL